MKKMLLGAVSLVSLVALTGCGDKKTLTCTSNSSDNGFTNEITAVYEFDGNKMTKVTQTSSITAEGDFAKYIDDYKDSAQTTADGFHKLNGFSAKVEASNNKVSVVVEMNPKKMSTDDYESYSMGENYDSMKAKLTDQGYTCK